MKLSRKITFFGIRSWKTTYFYKNQYYFVVLEHKWVWLLYSSSDGNWFGNKLQFLKISVPPHEKVENKFCLAISVLSLYIFLKAYILYLQKIIFSIKLEKLFWCVKVTSYWNKLTQLTHLWSLLISFYFLVYSDMIERAWFWKGARVLKCSLSACLHVCPTLEDFGATPFFLNYWIYSKQ